MAWKMLQIFPFWHKLKPLKTAIPNLLTLKKNGKMVIRLKKQKQNQSDAFNLGGERKNNYFGFIESAEIYVVKIYDYIEKDLVTTPHKSSPDPLKNHGSFYIFYKPNQRTTWYVFFEKSNQKIVVTSILNNHSEEARYLVETP